MKHLVKSIFVGAFALAISAQVLAIPNIEITDRLTWDVIGLDSNDEVNSGPDTFAVGYRICNTGDQTATNVLSTFAWESANTYINLSPGGPPTINIGSLDPTACYDAYYNVTVDRDDNARETARRYRIDVSSTGLPTVSTPIDANNYVEIYVENLISQNRNSINSITGPNVVYRGQIYTFVLTGSTATQGYEQLETFINFPNNIFRVISVESQYSAPVNPTINDRFYSDSCGWEHDPESPNYFTNGTNNACDISDKAGGNIILTYQIEIIGTGNATVTGLIYDFSGSSFHYNTDYGIDILSIEARELPSLTISDASQFEGNTGISQLSFSVTLSETKTEAITFDYATSNSGAESGVDYTATIGSITIPANTLTVTINVPVLGDLNVELDEQFTLTLSNPIGATISDDTATGTILNDDAVSSIDISANAVCINDTPYVEYDVSAVNFTPQSLATIDWVGLDGLVVQRLTDQPLTGGRVLWPGAVVDSEGNPTGWPGWEFVNGEWIQVPSTVRPNAILRISVNPTSEVTLSYPPASPACVAEPPGVSGRAISGSAPTTPVPVMGPLALLVLSLSLAGAAAYTQRRR